MMRVKDFFEKLKLAQDQNSPSRLVSYESFYFNGNFVGRLGETFAKPSLSLTISDQEISGAITVLIEAIADEMFSKTPVWVDKTDSPTTYYPGGTADKPSFLVFAGSANWKNYLQPISSNGCGMTATKAKVLTYVSERAGGWASGESGIVLGFFGGGDVGLPVILGKLSVGDNKVLQSIVQAVLSTAVKRASFQAAIPVLLSIDQTSDDSSATIQEILQLMKIE